MRRVQRNNEARQRRAMIVRARESEHSIGEGLTKREKL